MKKLLFIISVALAVSNCGGGGHGGKVVSNMKGISVFHIGDTYHEIVAKLDATGAFKNSYARKSFKQSVPILGEDTPELTEVSFYDSENVLGIRAIWQYQLKFCQDTLYHIDVIAHHSKADIRDLFIEKYGEAGIDEFMTWIDTVNNVKARYSKGIYQGQDYEMFYIETIDKRIEQKIETIKDRKNEIEAKRHRDELDKL